MMEGSSAMNPSDLSEMDIDSLKEKLTEIEMEVQRREADRKLRKAQELEDKAQAMGFVSLAEAARTLSSAPSRTRPTAVYVNPDNPEQTWSGRGRRPKWVHDHVRCGRAMEELVPAQYQPTDLQGED